MDKEIWKVFKDTRIRKNGRRCPNGALWEVSDQGRVKKNGELFECGLNYGYKIFGSNYKVSRAVAELFIPNPENKPWVDHINTIRTDDRVCNLRWVSPKENSNNPLTRKHNSEAQKIAQNKEETRKKRSNSLIQWFKEHPDTRNGENHPMWNKQQSKESNRKRSESLKIYWANKKSQYN